ncbi:hypothetical protein ACO0QE_002639 [Hanseniaspora vineae]
MTTELYPNDYFSNNEAKNPDHELKWLVDEIIKPQLSEILDTLQKCAEMLDSEESFKLPITSKDDNILEYIQHKVSKSAFSNADANTLHSSCDGLLKGTITRTKGAITDYQLLVQFTKFRKNQPQMIHMCRHPNILSNDPKVTDAEAKKIKGEKSESKSESQALTKEPSEIELHQLVATQKYTNIAINIIQNLQKTTNVHEFKKLFQELNQLFVLLINTITKPMDVLQFPRFTKPLLPQLESQHHLLVPEIVIISNEIVLEIRCLQKFDKKPWSNINKEGKSTCDLIKMELHDPKKKLTDILHNHHINIVEPSLFHSIMTYSSSGTSGGGQFANVTLTEAQDILSRSVTYQNQLFLEMGKVAVSTSDPYLITVCAKLAALQKTIYNAHLNLQFV